MGVADIRIVQGLKLLFSRIARREKFTYLDRLLAARLRYRDIMTEAASALATAYPQVQAEATPMLMVTLFHNYPEYIS
jgi:hypothetical protein